MVQAKLTESNLFSFKNRVTSHLHRLAGILTDNEILLQIHTLCLLLTFFLM